MAALAVEVRGAAVGTSRAIDEAGLWLGMQAGSWFLFVHISCIQNLCSPKPVPCHKFSCFPSVSSYFFLFVFITF
ncbi:hypothetical protein D3C75_1119010 [compost metagenome]